MVLATRIRHEKQRTPEQQLETLYFLIAPVLLYGSSAMIIPAAV
ncbi:MAG: hypothetical protein ACR2JB_15135 [Bryobacteraceae bacterium]